MAFGVTNLANKTDFNVSVGLLSASRKGPSAAVEDGANRDTPRAVREHLEEELQQAPGCRTYLDKFMQISFRQSASPRDLRKER